MDNPIRCPECPGVNNCISPDGPMDAECVLIGEAPGKQEDKKKQVFIGKTGEELNRHYLPLAGLKRQSVMITNAIKCLPDRTDGKLDANSQSDIDLLYSCASTHLMEELQQVQPKIIVPMGSFACRAIDPDIDLELQHGIPLKTAWGMTFPMYHPAGGIHEPKKMLHIRTDWIRFGKYLRGKLKVARDQYPNPDYQVADARRVYDDLAGCEYSPLACDTEITRKKDPFCLTYSVRPGTGRLILAEDTKAISAFQECISNWKSDILWHNWLFDYGVVTDMGLVFPPKRIVDTMVRVFHLGNMPQGLKPLAFRELGMKMQDFDDLVKPYSSERVIDFYKLAALETWEKPPKQMVVDSKTGLLKEYKPQSFNTKLKRFFTDLRKNPNKDPFLMWTKNWVDLQEMVEDRVGEWPGKCITHVPFDQALYYACRDADALLRIWPIIKRAISLMRRRPQEYWTGAIAA